MDDINIKLGDMIQSDTGSCGVVIRLPDNERRQYHYIMYWNRGEPKEWGTDPKTVKNLIEFRKWKVIPL